MPSETPKDAPAVPFFKKKSRPGAARKRETSPATSATALAGPSSTSGGGDPGTSSGTSEVIVPTKRTVANPLIQGTKRKRAVDAYDNDVPNDGEYDIGPDVKWKASGNTSELMDREREILEGEDAEDIIRKKRRELEDEERLEDGMYHGAKSYKNHIVKEKEIPKAMRRGPQKGQSTIKTVTLMDYQPDVCKDYKETGYCGFGDTCKFLHDRGTYLQGWQLDKLAADPKKQAQDESDDSSDEEDIPFACFVCRKPYTDPVVTRCSHYFCSACAIKRFAKTPKCAACGAPTNGIFNRADKVVEKMRAKQKAKEEKEANEEDADSDPEPRSKDLELEILDD